MAEPPADKPTATSSDLTDRVLGDFRLLRRLGIGGMAEVYLAEQISLSRSVAVKILLADAVSKKNSTLLQRFEREARAAGGLSHPNIVQVYMIGQADELHFIVQEYVQGQNLSQWFKKNGPPDFLTGLKWMKQVAAALKVASDAGIVHRDIKPENIMLTRSGDAKVTDFGLAQLIESNEKMNLTQAGTTMGTPWYMSPEQIQGEKLDHRSDQYSFGVTMYHTFAGQPPFPGKNSVSVAVLHLKENAKRLSEHRRDLPEKLCDVIHRMMEKKPEDRFATPDELLSAIQQLDHAALSPAIVDTSSVTGWLLGGLPSWRTALTALVLCLVAGFFAGRMLYEPSRLVASTELFPREETADRQYARAIVHAGNERAWKAVYENFPAAEEALWARLHLGIHYLTRPTPDLTSARREFDAILKQTSLNPVEHRELDFLTSLGLAYVAEQQPGQQAEREKIVFGKLGAQFADLLERDDLRAPELLIEFRNKIREELDV